MSDNPFALYEGGGRMLLGRPTLGDGTCRTGYGPPVFAECGMTCVYCGRDLGALYESWLDLSIDHVIPRGTVGQLSWDVLWVEDIANLVTCCRACNEFSNGYRVTGSPPSSLEEFFDLRDQHFSAKRAWLADRHARERIRYENR
jgi:hypothetical protein